MSFGLAVHNWRTLPISGGGTAPADGELEQLRVETGIGANHSQHVRGLIAAGANGKVMWHAGGDLSSDSTIFFSSDGGDTWSDQGLTLPDIPNDADSYISNLQYYQPDDTWYIVALDLNFRATYAFYSTNDGASWTRGSLVGASVTLSAHGLGMDVSDGSWFIAGRGTSNYGTFALKSSPTATPSMLQHVYPSTAYSVVKMGGKYYVKNRSSSAPSAQYITVVDFGSSTVTTYPNWGEATYEKYLFSESDGTRFFCPKGSLIDDEIVTLGVFTPSTDYSTPGSESEITLTYPERVRYCDTVYGNGWISIAFPYNAGEERRYIYVHYSADGVSWSSTPVKFTLPSGLDYGLDEDEATWRAKWGGGSTWYLAGTAEDADGSDFDRPGIWRFSINPAGGSYPPAPFSHPLYDTLASMAPDILVKLDDESGSTTVEDDGSKGYGNAVVGDVTFEVAGIVSDGGTAATFENSDASIDFASVSYGTHTHVVVYDYDPTFVYTLIETDHYAVVTDRDSTSLMFRDSDGTETDLNITLAGGGGAFIVQVDGSTVKAWDLTSYEAAHSFTASIAGTSGTLSIRGNEVTMDYYALIPNDNLSIDTLIAALSTEFSATPTAALAPSIGDGSVLCIVKAESTLTTAYDDGRQVTSIGNDVSGQPSPTADVFTPDASTVTSTQAKFGSKSLSIPYKAARSSRSVVSPYWRGLHATSILSRDFTIEGWIKPTLSNNFCYLGSSQAYTRVGSRDYRYGGLTIAISGTSGAGKMTLNIGHDVGTARSLRDNDLYRGNALTINANFGTLNDNDWNHVAVCRKNGVWYLYINGQLPTSEGRVGNNAAPVYDGDDFVFGAYLYPYSYRSGGTLTVSPSYGGGGGTTYYGLGRYSQPCYIDSFRFVLDEAVYTQQFTYPAVAFSA